MLRIAWVPSLSPALKGRKTFGPGGACFTEHVAALLGASGSVKGFGPDSEQEPCYNFTGSESFEE